MGMGKISDGQNIVQCEIAMHVGYQVGENGMGDPPPIVFLPSFLPASEQLTRCEKLDHPPSSLKSRVGSRDAWVFIPTYLRVCGRKGWSGKRREDSCRLRAGIEIFREDRGIYFLGPVLVFSPPSLFLYG